jgi:hypothetical protein
MDMVSAVSSVPMLVHPIYISNHRRVYEDEAAPMAATVSGDKAIYA